MKKIIFFAVLVIVFASCKKSSSGSPVNAITVTINDTPYTFNQDIIDTTIYQSSDSTIVIALEAKDVNLNTMIVAFGTKGGVPFKTGTYGLGDTTYLGEMGFEQPNNTTFSVLPPSPVSAPLTINVSSLSTTFVQGTFKGT